MSNFSAKSIVYIQTSLVLIYLPNNLSFLNSLLKFVDFRQNQYFFQSIILICDVFIERVIYLLLGLIRILIRIIIRIIKI